MGQPTADGKAPFPAFPEPGRLGWRGSMVRLRGTATRGRTGTALVRCAPPEPSGNELQHCYRRRSRRCEERCRKAAVEAPLRSPLSARQGLGAPGLLPAHSRTPPETRFGPYPDGCQDGGRPKNPGRSLPKREKNRRSLPKREKRALVLTWTDLPLFSGESGQNK